MQDDDSTLTKEIKSRIESDLRNRYLPVAMSLLLDKSTFIDPRFKQSFSFDDDIVKEILVEMEDFLTNEQPVTASYPDFEPPPAKNGKFSKIFGTISCGSISEAVLPSQRVKKEIEMYFQYPTLHIDEPPLTWWRQEATRMPTLSALAKKYLCVCASSVASERMFSKAGNIVTSKRSCLKPEHVEQLMFLSKNLL